jgi:hypothetical protein
VQFGSLTPPGDINGDGVVDQDDYILLVQDIGAWGQGEQSRMKDWFNALVESSQGDAFIVTLDNDVDNGDDTFYDLSLREALSVVDDGDKIYFAPWVHDVELTSGQLVVAQDVQILGPRAEDLTIDAQGNGSVFYIASGVEATLSGMTITGGSSLGGGIYTDGSLELVDAIVSGNTSSNNGGGILVAPAASLSVINSTIADNVAQNAGGGIYAFSGSVDIKNSSILNNDTLSSTVGTGGNLYFNNAPSVVVDATTIDGGQARYGAGVYYIRSGGQGTATFRNSTISNNNASRFGGGFSLGFGGNVDFRILNTTISSNDAIERGGGIYFDTGGSGVGLQIINATVAYNEVASASAGGGIYNQANRAKIILHNTIVAENLALGSSHNIFGLVSTTSSFNLVGPLGVGGLSGGLNNLFVPSGQSAGLAPLAFNGGPTKTHGLLLASLAVDAGDDSKAAAFALIDDQRGDGFDRVVDRVGSPEPPGFDIDIGAVEVALEEVFS